MKKLLLLSCFLMAVNAKAQDKWTQYATSQPVANTGIKSISIVDDNVSWLNMSCGFEGCTAIRRYSKTEDGGMTWTTGEIDLGTDNAQLEIANISGTSATDAYAAVYPKGLTTPGILPHGGVWRTNDGGKTWTKQQSALYNNEASLPAELYFWNANEGVVIGDPVDGYFEIYTTVNAGNTWTRVPSTAALIPLNPEEYIITNNFYVYGDTLWTLTTIGRLLKSTDKGATWTVSQVPFPDFGGGIAPSFPPHLAFTDQNYGLLQSDDFVLYNTNDGGVTWAEVTWAGTLRNFGITSIPGLTDTYITVGEDINGERGSSFSVDGGLNWININNNPDIDFVDGGVVAFRASHMGFASGFSTSAAVGGIFKWNTTCICAAVATFPGDKSIIAAPNPTSGTLNILGRNINQAVVCDLLGNQIAVTDYNAVDNINLNLDFLARGVYLIKVFNDQGFSTLKVVRQ